MEIFEKSVRKSSSTMFGRQEIAIPYKENELTSEIITEILPFALKAHFVNMQDIRYLKSYTKGNQTILSKTKKVRPDINNIVVENNAYHVVEFKKGYVFGDPIQYVQRSEASEDELSKLNSFMLENDKSSKDKDLAEDMYISGVGYRIVLPSSDEDKPFVLDNLNNENTFVIYSTDIHKTPLMACYIMQRLDNTEIMCYTKNNVIYYDSNMKNKRTRETEVKLKKIEVNPLGQIPIFEYRLNKNRLGVVELIMSQLDTLNKITSSDIDDIEQFIQSLLVFINQDIEKEKFTDMVELGALMLSDTIGSQLRADVKLLSQKLEHSETKILYTRIYENMLTIAGVPKMSDRSSGGDTGQARLVGEGWIMADERAKQDELAFKVSERKMLRLVLDICKVKRNSGIKQLKASDLEIKFTRNKSDNLLVKTQALMNLMNSQVSPDVAFGVVGLFSDPAEVVKQSKQYFGETFWKKEEVAQEAINSAVEVIEPIE